MFNTEIRKYYDWSDAGGDAMSGARIGGAIGSAVPGVGTLIGAGAGALLGSITGLFQKKKGNALLKQNPYPTEPIPNELLANQQQAQRMADEGMPSAQYQQAQKNIQRQQVAAIQSAQDRRLGGATISGVQQATNDAQANLDAKSAEMRRQNQLNLQSVNNDVAGYRSKAFDWNQKNRYLQAYQLGNSLVGAGNANMFAGADKLLAGLTGAYSNGLFSGRSGGSSVPSTNGANSNVNLADYGITAI